MVDDDLPSLGPCCSCERAEGVTNILMLRQRAPVPGTGWACLQCGLPADGAYAVLCDECMAKLQDGAGLKMAVSGYPAAGERVAIASLSPEPFDHDLSRHPELTPVSERACRECGCTEASACPGGCYWVEPDLCSRCARTDDLRVEGDEEHDFDDEDPGDECGRWSNGRLTQHCALAGTEFCDFECPYGD